MWPSQTAQNVNYSDLKVVRSTDYSIVIKYLKLLNWQDREIVAVPSGVKFHYN